MYTEKEISALKSVSSRVSSANEGGYNYILLEDVKLPDGCTPEQVDVLLCPVPREGYNSRLFFSEKITGDVANGRNWNGDIRIMSKNWFAISWAVPANLDLLSILLVHLKAFRK